MKYKNIFFDLDGTLTDSGEGIMNSAKYAFEQLKIEPPCPEDLRKFVGPPLRYSFPLFGVPEDKVEEAVALYREKYNNQGGKYQNRVYPGIEIMLQELKNAGCSLYIATSKPEPLARELAAYFHLDSYFDFIAGATMDKARDSKASVIKYLIEITGYDKSTIMVGDSHLDAIGAHDNGLGCICVSWGYGSREEFIAAGAEAIVNSPAELCNYLF